MRDLHLMSDTARLVTAHELERFPRDDRRYELVAGRIVRMTPVGYPHGRIAAQFAALLRQHVGETRLGVVFVELGVVLSSNPDTVRAADVAFIGQDRIPAVERKTVEIVRPASSKRLTRPDEQVDLDDVVPGFRCPAGDIFNSRRTRHSSPIA